jgi:alpha-L-fucosidase
MKSLKINILLLLIMTVCHGQNEVKNNKLAKGFEAKWESLEKVNQAPNWFQDAKFGIYSHWGPVSSAFEGADPKKHYAGWHGMKMYEDGKKVPTKNGQPTSNFEHHKKKYGDPKKYGYKHIIEQFNPSGFNAKEWGDLFAKSGARFAVQLLCTMIILLCGIVKLPVGTP